ncbi:Histone acetyltransferase HPA2 [Candidatus Rhodobacter oscarellae]|uniref:Histone acetyltransferase HPA2 n=1 Tax=Candidatus Rhodobacter oscarellae TaxID=1675527 RepID=A0A0J9E6B9_9RHOB|nr:GNAT family N-acetyltransferase [Candidatus Rhodobacter lobularis]KMW58227.1 Histone acetyltransferase HPA2 [Candidatus Rhodobacter lobularis]
MSVSVDFVSKVPELAAFRALLLDYYADVLETAARAGLTGVTPQEATDGSIADLPKMLPPKGRLLLASNPEGRLVGCGALVGIRADAAEMKRMYVRPEARGTGLGRRLFEMRIEEARRMGCTSIYADTARGNRAMLSMYERFGFRYIPRYPENANPPEFEPYLVYLRFDFPPGG